MPSFLLSCFVSRLNPELHREVHALRPLSLPQAAKLAGLQEDKINDRRHGPRSPSSAPLSHPVGPYTGSIPKLPFKRLTSEEMVVRYKPRLHILIADEDVDFAPMSPLPDHPKPSDPDPL